MKQIKIGGSYVCYKEFKISENPDLQEFLEEKKLTEFINSFEENIIFVLGGDGTMLEAVRKHYKKRLPFMGINFGRKGFFSNPKELMIPGLKYIKCEYTLLEVEDEETKETHIAMNEIDMRSKNGKLSTFNINISERNSFSLDGDGVIVATPLGSTGYNSSLRGPILLENVKNFVITPKAPWKPKLFPSIIVSEDEEIKISNSGRKNPIFIFADGNKVFRPSDTKDSAFIIRKSKYSVKLIVLHECIQLWNNRIFDNNCI